VKAFYERLLARGKRTKVALVALARTLLRLAGDVVDSSA